MGGHGGLNILPQKRWHLYRWDNRLKVERDQREAQEKRDAETRESNRAALSDKLDELRLRRKRSPQSCSGEEQEDDSTKKRRTADFDEGSEQEVDFDEVSKHSDKTKIPVSNKKDTNSHFNLFKEEEETFARSATAHQKYLKEIGHSNKDVSAFDVVKGVRPWYLLPLPSHIQYESSANGASKAYAVQDAEPSLDNKSCSSHGRHSKKKHESKKSHKKSKKHSHENEKSRKLKTSKTLDEMRLEREAREKAESQRAYIMQPR